MLGQMVGAYRVIKRLGVGGMGAVYEALEPNIGKRVALKIVHPHLSTDPRLPDLLAEARAVNAIGDEGIVNIFAFGTLPDFRSYLVMELLEGESLEVRLARQKRLTALEVIEIFVPLMQALEAAHAAGFVHRDIKTANIFVVQRPPRPPFPKLLDFGIAQRIKTKGDALGTAAYIAPEQASNTNVGAKADLYAVGCTLYELLSGQLPFIADSTAEIVRLQREAPRPSLANVEGVPAELDDLVRALMSVEPSARPASAATVRTTLLELKAKLVAQAAPPKRKPVALLATVGVITLAVIAFMVWRPTGAQITPPPQADPVAMAAAKTQGEIEHLLEGPPVGAVDALLAAEASFPQRPEWQALRGRVTAALRLEAQAALKKDDADRALASLASLGRLAPLPDDEPLLKEAKRSAFARHNGMVRVGDVFIDRYEYPNRAGSPPATEIDFADAVKLCEDAGKHLCSETEWETACRGAAGNAFPYGADFKAGTCVSKGKKVKGPAASGAHASCVTAEGVFDLSGNVAEWTSTPLRDGAPQRVTRGGSFMQSDAKLACDARDYSLPGLGGAKHLGLRCCL